MNTFNLNLHAKVHCKNGPNGKLTKLVLDPDTYQISHLIVAYGLLHKQTRIVPLTLVKTTEEEIVYLSINSDQLDSLPVYDEVEIEVPIADATLAEAENKLLQQALYHDVPPSPQSLETVRRKVHQGVCPQSKVITAGIPVQNWEGQIGHLTHISIEAENGHIVQLTIQHGLLTSLRLTIPFYMIETLEEDRVQITGTKEELKSLDYYSSQDNNEPIHISRQNDPILEHTPELLLWQDFMVRRIDA